MGKKVSKQEQDQQLIQDWLKKNKPAKGPDSYGHDHHDNCRASSINTEKYLKDFGANYNNLATSSPYTT